MKSSFGKNIKVSIWGGSHEPAIGTDIEGLPIGTEIDMKALTAFLKRRAPGNSPFATKRKEADIPVPVSGLTDRAADDKNTSPASDRRSRTSGGTNIDVPTGGLAIETTDELANPADDSANTRSLASPAGNASAEHQPDSSSPARTTTSASTLTVVSNRISLEIRNTDTRSQDYKTLRTIPRPGHADYTARLRYGDALNMAGGGPFSARMTAPLCIAGGIALQLLRNRGIHIGAHIYSIADIKDTPFDPVATDPALLEKLKTKDFAVIDETAKARMQETITNAQQNGDSVGGIIEGCVLGLPGGIGGAMYDGLESVLAPIFFGIPAVKGVEFGAGFSAAFLKGSENNDPFYYDGGHIKTRTNHHGGILGGITTGMPLIARLAFKPTPSISREQDSVDLEKCENAKLVIKGRHDPCVAVRAVPIVEAALALGILDCMMEENHD